MQQMRDDIDSMKQMLNQQAENASAFNNTVIASMSEIAADVCAVNGNAEFCQVLQREYKRMSQNTAPKLLSDNQATPTQDSTKATNNVHVFDSDYASSSDDDL